MPIKNDEKASLCRDVFRDAAMRQWKNFRRAVKKM
jgi:hypothetical protein